MKEGRYGGGDGTRISAAGDGGDPAVPPLPPRFSDPGDWLL